MGLDEVGRGWTGLDEVGQGWTGCDGVGQDGKGLDGVGQGGTGLGRMGRGWKGLDGVGQGRTCHHFTRESREACFGLELKADHKYRCDITITHRRDENPSGALLSHSLFHLYT